MVMNAVGGENVTTIIEGRERYPLNVRYLRDLRGDIIKLKRVLVNMNSQAQIPVSQLASVEITAGPSMILDENGMLNGYVYLDISARARRPDRGRQHSLEGTYSEIYANISRDDAGLGKLFRQCRFPEEFSRPLVGDSGALDDPCRQGAGLESCFLPQGAQTDTIAGHRILSTNVAH